ncbi:MAG: hypothetical protein U0Q21_02880 [Dermatophilaceae bacterium]
MWTTPRWLLGCLSAALLVLAGVTVAPDPAAGASAPVTRSSATARGRVAAVPASARHRSSAAASSPTDWAATCSAKALGLDSDVVELAPRLPSDPDLNPDKTPVAISPDSRGRYTPVIVVHGWTSRATHTTTRDGAFSHVIDLTANRVAPKVRVPRSLIGQLQRIEGVAVFTFDYHQYSARWVDDVHLGPALGKVVDCLHRASGERVILVGHSLGGLIARYAATHPTGKARDRAAEISTVVTLGTPEKGSLAALLADGAANASAATAPSLAVVRLILAQCGRLSSASLESGTLCDVLPAQVRAFDSAAGRALRHGSAQLSELKPWPRGIRLVALAGRSDFRVAKLGWFAAPWATDSIDVGDIVVTADSALSGATDGQSVSCAFQLSVVRGATDAVGLAAHVVSEADVARAPWASFSTPCFHTQLMRSIELTNDATGEVADDIWSRQPVTVDDLSTAPVPSLCDHSPGTLVDGRLPEVAGELGPVELTGQGLVALGDLDGDGRGDAAAVVTCSQGGVGWPNEVVAWTRGRGTLTVLGSMSVSEATGAARDGITSITYADQALHLAGGDARKYDYGCCASGSATFDVVLRDGHLRATEIHHLVGPTDILFDRIGDVRLGMTPTELAGLGYSHTAADSPPCAVYTKSTEDPVATVDTATGLVARIDPPSLQGYQTYLGGITHDSLLTFIEDAFAGIPLEKHVDRDFGEGTTGVVARGPDGGGIGMELDTDDPDQLAQGFASVAAIHVGTGVWATNAEICT